MILNTAKITNGHFLFKWQEIEIEIDKDNDSICVRGKTKIEPEMFFKTLNDEFKFGEFDSFCVSGFIIPAFTGNSVRAVKVDWFIKAVEDLMKNGKALLTIVK